MPKVDFPHTSRMLAQTAVTAKNGGSVFDFFYDKGITNVSLYGNSNEMLSAFNMLAAEEMLTAYKFISNEGINFYNVSSVQRSERLDSITEYNSSIPILILDDNVSNEIYSILSTLSEHVYSAFRILKYSALKNAIIVPIRNICPEVTIVYVNRCYAHEISNKSPYENLILNETKNDIPSLMKMKLQYGYDSNEEYFDNCLKNVQELSFTIINGIVVANNITSKYINIRNGLRNVTDVPAKSERNIYFLGNSLSYGYLVSDSDTIESKLQLILNKHFPSKYAVSNIVCKSGHSVASYTEFIKCLPIKPWDIVVLMAESSGSLIWPQYVTSYTKDIIRINTSSFFNRPHNMGEVFIDSSHMNGKGNQKYAEIIYDILKKENIFNKKFTPNKSDAVYEHKDNSSIHENDELNRYLDSLKLYRRQGSNGAIVMNCNPFTLGHLYLVEYAAKNVDNLYIFISEDDTSLFPFEDRIDLVQKGITGMKNVMILSSGKFIHSQQSLIADNSDDIIIFGSLIAPILNLSVWFTGEETFNNTMIQNNQKMKVLLSEYGIRFDVIPKKEIDRKVISTSYVRKMVKERNFEKLSKLVPDSTLAYLKSPKAAICCEASAIYERGIELSQENEEDSNEDIISNIGFFQRLRNFLKSS